MDWHIKPIPHFTLEEMRCRCGCNLVILDEDLLDALDKVRDMYGLPVIVNSMVRCKTHNTAVGGVANSYHLNGRAVDVRPVRGGSIIGLDAVCSVVFPFVKRYDTFLHCDVRGERPFTRR